MNSVGKIGVVFFSPRKKNKKSDQIDGEERKEKKRNERKNFLNNGPY